MIIILFISSYIFFINFVYYLLNGKLDTNYVLYLTLKYSLPATYNKHKINCLKGFSAFIYVCNTDSGQRIHRYMSVINNYRI